MTGFEPSCFSRKFRQATGVTYKEYLDRKRLKNSVRDLTATEMTINETAFSEWFPECEIICNYSAPTRAVAFSDCPCRRSESLRALSTLWISENSLIFLTY